ncbi:hypothetical protein [uncultured Methanobrevibacter sp.]|uniref:hypothetical protein n=1 Tax=uncultured Methanobrevibacter sp. TaxID=253161 RepID=UPI0025F6CE6F|nr:hypothetical protein [uncultured Methanobrevibacter sp.]
MKKIKLLLIISLILLMLLGINTISASDSNTTLERASYDDLEINHENFNEINGKDPINGGTFEDIQTAIENANDGDTIQLNGTFKSTGKEINIDKNITINGGQKTILDAKGFEYFFKFELHAKNITINGITFINAAPTVPEYAISPRYNAYGNYSFVNCTFENNNGDLIGSVKNIEFTLYNCNFTNNGRLKQAVISGTNIYNCNFVKNSIRLWEIGELENCNFTENVGNDSYLIFNVKSIRNSNFIKNNGYLSSLIFNVGSVENSNFIENSIIGNGILNTVDSITDCNFENNFASYREDHYREGYYIQGYSGEGVVNGVNSVKNSNFTNNKASAGGAIYSAKIVRNCYFENNEASYGGAIASVADVAECTFINNRALADGGAIASGINIRNCYFLNNKVTKGYKMYGGGAIHIRDKEASITDCEFIGNFANTFGSAIFIFPLSESTVSLSNLKFSKNTANGNYDTMGYLFKSYGDGLIVQMGNDKINVNFENCEGIIKNTDKFKLKTVMKTSQKGNYITVNIGDKYKHPFSGLKITVNIGGKSFTGITDNAGNAKILINNLAPKKYTAKIRYTGDEFMLKSSKSLKINVKKLTPKFSSMKVNGKKFSANLKVADKAVKKVKVSLKIKGKTYSAKTNSKGIATFKLKKGNYKGKLDFTGNSHYNKASKSVKFKIR